MILQEAKTKPSQPSQTLPGQTRTFPFQLKPFQTNQAERKPAHKPHQENQLNAILIIQ